jgi:transcription antitermination factor NusG
MTDWTNPHWYAARISGHATRVARHRMIFHGPNGGPYQYLVPDIDRRMTIEMPLDALDLEYFLPVASKEFPHRRKRGVWVTEREPILPGYVFVRNVRNWQALEFADGVIGILRCGHENVRIPALDIHRLRMVEWECYVEYERARAHRIDPPKKKLGRKYVEGSRHTVNHKRLGHIDFTVMSVTSRQTIRAIHDKLGKIELKVDDIEEVA